MVTNNTTAASTVLTNLALDENNKDEERMAAAASSLPPAAGNSAIAPSTLTENSPLLPKRYNIAFETVKSTVLGAAGWGILSYLFNINSRNPSNVWTDIAVGGLVSGVWSFVDTKHQNALIDKDRQISQLEKLVNQQAAKPPSMR